MATMVQAARMELQGVNESVSPSVKARENVAKNVLLFLAAPLIGLAYIIALPLVGTVAMVRVALR